MGYWVIVYIRTSPFILGSRGTLLASVNQVTRKFQRIRKRERECAYIIRAINML